MVAGLKQIGWAPKIVGWGGLNDFGITASQVPPGTVDGCVLSYAPGQPTSALLTPENTDLLKESEAKIGLNPETSGILTGYMYLLAVKHAIETANSLDGTKLAAALSATSSLPTERSRPGPELDRDPVGAQRLPQLRAEGMHPQAGPVRHPLRRQLSGKGRHA